MIAGRGRASCAALALALAWGCSARQLPPAEGTPGPMLTVPPGGVLERACVVGAPERCFDARDDDCDGVIDDGCGVATGPVQVALAWEDDLADLDLEVIDPAGDQAEVGATTRSGLIKERDCPGPRGECLGQNLENVFQESGEPLRGRWRVVVRFEKLGAEEPPLTATLGARLGQTSHAVRLTFGAVGEQREIGFEL